MNYDFARRVIVEGEEIMIMFTSVSESREGPTTIKQLTGFDDANNNYTAIATEKVYRSKNADNYKLIITDVTRL